MVEILNNLGTGLSEIHRLDCSLRLSALNIQHFSVKELFSVPLLLRICLVVSECFRDLL